MNFLKLIFNFFNDLKKIKKNILIKNSESTYQIMRYLYLLSDGLLLDLISKFLDSAAKPSSKFGTGYIKFNKNNIREIDEIKENILKMKLANKEVKNEKIKLDNEKNIHFEYYKKKSLVRLDIMPYDLLKSVIVSKFVLKDCWIEQAKKILGTTPYMVGINAWITLPPPEKIYSYDDIKQYVSSQMWHRDCDKLRDLKIMTYLTDVKSENEGPFEYIDNSHCFNFFNPFRYSSSMRIKNDYIQKKYKKKISTFTGNAGTSFIVDTRGIHRGKTITKKNYFRLMLEIYISNNQFGKNKSYPAPAKDWQSYDLWTQNLKTKPNYKFLFNN